MEEPQPSTSSAIQKEVTVTMFDELTSEMCPPKQVHFQTRADPTEEQQLNLNLKMLWVLSFIQGALAVVILLLQVATIVIVSLSRSRDQQEGLQIFEYVLWIPMVLYMASAILTWLVATRSKARSWWIIGTAMGLHIISAIVGLGLLFAAVVLLVHSLQAGESNNDDPVSGPLMCYLVIIFNSNALVIAFYSSVKLCEIRCSMDAYIQTETSGIFDPVEGTMD